MGVEVACGMGDGLKIPVLRHFQWEERKNIG